MENSTFLQKYGPWAIVTGASSGIGAEFARALAGKDLNLLLVARRRAKLEALGAELAQNHGIQTLVIEADLSTVVGVETLIADSRPYDVGLLINNAGFLTLGKFTEQAYGKAVGNTFLNVLAPAQLAHVFGNRFVERGKGGIVFTSSMAALQGTGYMSTYAAEKGYQLLLGEAMNLELKAKGVDVMVLLPGQTESEIASKMVADGFVEGALPISNMKAEVVVRIALNALGKKAVVIPGFLNRFTAFIGKHLLSRSGNSKMWTFIIGKAMSEPTIPLTNGQTVASN
jgi:uncharacterized protein